MPSIAQASRHSLAYVAESEPGVTPANPAMKWLRQTGCTLGLSRDSFLSEELRHDRQITDVRTGTDNVSGDINFEFIVGEYDELLAACLAGTWAGNVLKSGTEEKSFTIERRFNDIGQYVRYRGCYMNSLRLNLQPNAMTSASFGVIGLSGEVANTPLVATPAASQQGRPFDTFTGELKEGGAVIAVVTSVDFTLDNGIQPQYVLYKRPTAFVSWGRSNVSGTMNAFFRDALLVRKFLDETPTSLEFTMMSPDGEGYAFTMPNVRYTSADMPINGDGPVQLEIAFQAVLDTDSGTNLIIEKV